MNHFIVNSHGANLKTGDGGTVFYDSSSRQYHHPPSATKKLPTIK